MKNKIKKLINKEKEKEINELKDKVEKQNKEINKEKEMERERESENKIKELKNQIIFLFENVKFKNDKSVIMKDDERNMIFSEIK